MIVIDAGQVGVRHAFGSVDPKPLPPEQMGMQVNVAVRWRHRVEVARLQAEQQRLLTQTLTAEALTKQYLEVLHDIRTSNTVVLIVPAEGGGMPVLDVGALRKNLTAK